MVDYTFQQTSPLQNVLSGFQTGMAIRDTMLQRKQAEIAAQEAAKLKAQQEAVLAKVRSPTRTADDIFQASLILPETMRKGMLEGWKALGDDAQKNQMSFASQVLSSLNGGKPEIAADLLETKAIASDNSGNLEEAKAYRDLAKLTEIDPESAFLAMSTQVAMLPGGKDAVASVMAVREEQRKAGLQPSVIAKTAADLEYTQAQTAKAVADAKKSEAEIAKVNAEAGKVATEAAKMKLEMKKGLQLTTAGEKLLNEAVDASINSASLATQYDALASEIEKDIKDAGLTGRAAEASKRIMGDEDNVTRLRQEFRRLRNSAVLKMLPPGVASDKDIEIAMGAFPEDTANPELIASFMKGMAKMQRYDSQLNKQKAAWVQRVGNLGTPDADIMIDGNVVSAGTSFDDYMSSVISAESPEASPEVPGGRKRLKYNPETGGFDPA